MTISGDDLLGSILASLERISYIEPEDIPGIDLYMDQVTGFLDKRLRSTVRNPGDGRIMYLSLEQEAILFSSKSIILLIVRV
ncbi:MAG: DUF1836 domain-containing protein [Lachnospiraceae bacterium]|nr:DUF1836 domain-containing protein [Lachnospiraceae bacterium]